MQYYNTLKTLLLYVTVTSNKIFYNTLITNSKKIIYSTSKTSKKGGKSSKYFCTTLKLSSSLCNHTITQSAITGSFHLLTFSFHLSMPSLTCSINLSNCFNSTTLFPRSKTVFFNCLKFLIRIPNTCSAIATSS